MKKVIALSLALLLSFALLAGCSAAPAASSSAAPHLDGTLEEILEQVYEGIDELPMVETMELTDENSEYNVGVARSEYQEGIASNAMINAIAYSVCLLRADSADVAASLAADVKEKADPAKWICVQAEETVVEQIGDVVLLVMASEELAEQISANFLALGA